MSKIDPLLKYLLRPSRRRIDTVAESLVKGIAAISILLILLIFFFVFREASSLFFSDKSNPVVAEQSVGGESAPSEYNPDGDTLELTPLSSSSKEPEPEKLSLFENLFSKIWQPVSSVPKFGILPLIVGTAKTTLIAILIGAPLAILAALNITFFAPRRVREIVKPAIEMLANFPSVVIGFFCLMDVATLVKATFDLDFRLNALTGGIGLAIAVTPIIFTVAEDALSTVPQSYRQAALALGATEWQTAYRVMLPAALPGVFAAVLLGVGRAFGETMIALMATGNAPLMSFGIFDPSRTFAATIGAEMGEVIWGSEHYNILFFLGVLLFLFTFSLNAFTELYVKKKLMKKFHGS
ncbi:phosphate ABC transporter permease subunit PstC [Leptospira wolffii]|uniref:Phosphate transport system permease protein n=1 Tax=Leptospira wolffii TaxID=409998 RepID=A0A2M9ZAV5_9LEPT|nr:phosphate ABC transporter permease subunit PstC [Leptospira wolffii]EPG66808.1 phosphate ABC transporter, permease protein PstC [Leptospira wolffii serovar Khorat str. Khorat-H2]PJZ65550.1 phosphate ABC transporter permease subunit PstC [Leptospira wolffii]TGK56234.1 phosphate ABC transporter permease subunit PstC [Leptospira wolffii]TGK72281.1 phosphate ABC transporter permease subunit PstC [Leptospira wolffii]TGK72813.1 phosphate ABC transporter permease subunit PstC [Leptospira wolffii]